MDGIVNVSMPVHVALMPWAKGALSSVMTSLEQFVDFIK